jgi:cyclophilin family peptidyl-prolyl cis-trans isomerase
MGRSHFTVLVFSILFKSDADCFAYNQVIKNGRTTQADFMLRKQRVSLRGHHDVDFEEDSTLQERRLFLKYLASLSILKLDVPATNAEDIPAATLAPVTQKILIDVRISRQDGTFYVRDDLEDTPENRVFYGRLSLGLFGTVAPKMVEQFLSYVDVNTLPDDDNPFPSYARSSFVSLDQSTGLLLGGYIPSLEAINLQGSTALKYGNRILPAPLWFDVTSMKNQDSRLSHSVKGLLTHRNLELLPSFGITTRPASAELDATHTVFGQLLDNDDGRKFLELVQDIPTYSLTRPMDPTDAPIDAVASAVFTSQREFFRSAAQTFGDSRLSKVFPGKLLRRVEVTQVQVAPS